LAVAKLQKRNLANATEERSVGRGVLQLIEFGDTTISRITYQPGWRWSEDVRPIVGGELCMLRHIGICISGTLRVEMDDGAVIELGPDDAYEVPPGHDAWVVGEDPWVAIDSEGRRYFARVSAESDNRTLSTILFTDLVSSTETLARIGDAAWRDRLADYHLMATRQLEKNRGREVNTTGDGILAVFDSPARAVRCAMELTTGAANLGVEQRAGLHTGEVEVSGSDVRGIAVHVAARVAAAAGGREVLVSATTNSLLAGAGLATASRGVQKLKGIEQPVELFAVEIGQLADQ
jgi:class 3 adenylate cyclase